MSETPLYEKHNELNCFGYLYDPLLLTCRKTCDYRILCHKEVMKKIREEGQENFNNSKLSILNINEIKITDNEFIDQDARNSELVDTILSYLSFYNLDIINRRNYISLKPKGLYQNYFSILRRKATDFKNLVYFNRISKLDNAPEGLKKFLSVDRRANFRHHFVGKNMDEFKAAVKLYIDYLLGEAENVEG